VIAPVLDSFKLEDVHQAAWLVKSQRPRIPSSYIRDPFKTSACKFDF
jgi:hypothetical protein